MDGIPIPKISGLVATIGEKGSYGHTGRDPMWVNLPSISRPRSYSTYGKKPPNIGIVMV